MFKAKNHRFGFFIGDMMYQFLSQALLSGEINMYCKCPKLNYRQTLAFFCCIYFKMFLLRFSGIHNAIITDKNLSKWQSTLGRLKRCVSSQTIFLRSATTFSHYLGLKHCRKPKIENFYEFFHPDGALRSFTT